MQVTHLFFILLFNLLQQLSYKHLITYTYIELKKKIFAHQLVTKLKQSFYLAFIQNHNRVLQFQLKK